MRLKFRDRQRNQFLSQFLHPRKKQLDRLRETAHFFGGLLDVYCTVTLFFQQLQRCIQFFVICFFAGIALPLSKI